MHISQDKVVLRTDPSFIPKINSKFHTSQEIYLPSFCPKPTHPKERLWHTLDVKHTLKIYIQRIVLLCKSKALFINISLPHMGKRMSNTAISKALRNCIKEAYTVQGLPVPGEITAHSTRSAATNAAFDRNVPVEAVCRVAIWSSLLTFIRHYKLNLFDSAHAAFGRWILMSILDDDRPPPDTMGHCS